MHDQVIKWTKAKVHVFSDSVLCVEKMQEQFRSEAKMECSTQRISTVQFLQSDFWDLMEKRLS